MNYRSCEALQKHFIITEEGEIACPKVELVINNSLQRAYIFTNVFFYEITQREIKKLTDKINAKKEDYINNSGIDAADVDQLFARISAQFKMELGDASLDPLIKTVLATDSKHLSLQLSYQEQQAITDMYEAICLSEIDKFKAAVIFPPDRERDAPDKVYEVNFSEKYINNLPPRCRQFLKPTIKMLAYMDGLQFATFDLAPNYQLHYSWADTIVEFNENRIKEEIKSVIAGNPNPGV